METIKPNEQEQTAQSLTTNSQPETPRKHFGSSDTENTEIISVAITTNSEPEGPNSPSADTETSVILGNSMHYSDESPADIKPLTPAIGNTAAIVQDAITVTDTQSSFPTSFIPFFRTENAIYGTIDTADCFRSQEHINMFNYAEEEGAFGAIESYSKFGRLKPVFGIPRMVDDKPMFALIDGDRYFKYATATGITKIFVCIITINDTDEIVKIMAQLQFSNHNTYMSLFLIIQNLWPLHYKGQGYRSDLNDEQFDEEKPYSDENKRLNIYQKIGREIGLSGNAVKFIRKIGLVNSLHFKQIETTRHSLYAAYLACKNEVAGNEPAPPKPKAPTFIRTLTNNPPEFSTTDSTGVVPPGVNLSVNNTPVPVATSVTPAADDAEYIIVRGICECCNQETNIRIPKSLCK